MGTSTKLFVVLDKGAATLLMSREFPAGTFGSFQHFDCDAPAASQVFVEKLTAAITAAYDQIEEDATKAPPPPQSKPPKKQDNKKSAAPAPAPAATVAQQVAQFDLFAATAAQSEGDEVAAEESEDEGDE